MNGTDRPHRIQFYLTLMMLILTMPACVMAQETSPDAPPLFAKLQARLIRDDFAPETIRNLYQRPDVRFEARHVSLYFVHRESTLNYDQYIAPALIAAAREYLKTHAAEMDAAEKNYDVDRHVIAAILLVETRLGLYKSRSPVMGVLSTMAALADEGVRNRFWDEIAATTNFTRAEYDEKAIRKAEWAYQELKAFIRYTMREGIDPGAALGSYAGAMGIPQFMPSNALTLAVDGDGDGRVDLYNHADAIASVANYFKDKGWKSGLSREEAYAIVLRYNYSSFYANTILKIRDLLKG